MNSTCMSEETVLSFFNLNSEIFYKDNSIEELIFKIEKIKFIPPFNCDDLCTAKEFLDLPVEKVFSTVSALKLMIAVYKSSKFTSDQIIALQKVIVKNTLAPWLLDKDIFNVGLCYYGNFGEPPSSYHQLLSLVNFPTRHT